MAQQFRSNFVKFIFPMEMTHRCTKRRHSFCPFETSTGVNPHKREHPCIGLKSLMEDYGKLMTTNESFDSRRLHTLHQVFDLESPVCIRRNTCCNTFEILEGNHRLCISKRTGIPIYGIYEESHVPCYDCRRANLRVKVTNMSNFHISEPR